jgi:outer membrane autotransporter protein
MNGARFALILSAVFTLCFIDITSAQSINLDTTYVHWSNLGNQGDNLFGWSDATASNDGFVNVSDGDHFDDAMGVRIGGVAYGGDINAALVDGLKITLPSQSISGMNVQVQFLASNTSAVMRQLVTIQNPTGSDFNSTISWINNTGNDSSQVTIGTSSGDLAQTIGDRWIATADHSDVNLVGTEANVFVMYGPDAPAATTTSVAMVENEGSFGSADDEGLTATLAITVPAGETRYIMFFVGATVTGQEGLDLATAFDDTASAIFQSLVSDLTADQVAQILNWAQFNSFTFVGIAQTPNQMGIGRVFDLVFNGSSTGDNLAVWNTLSGLTDAQKRSVMQQSIPQINMAGTAALIGSQHMLGDIIGQRTVGQLKAFKLGQDRLNRNTVLAAVDNAGVADAVDAMNQKPSRGLNLWVQSINNFGDQDSDSNAAGYSWQSFGGAIGLDRMINDQCLLGLALAGYNTDVDGAQNTGHADITTVSINAYGGWSNGQTHIDGGIGVGFSDNQTRQTYGLLGLTADGEYDSLSFNSWVNIGHVLDLKTKCPVKVEPIAGLQYQIIHDQGYTQTGAGALNQTIDRQNTNSLISRVGLNFIYDLELANDQQIQLIAGTAWCHEFLDDQIQTQSSLSGSSFTANGVDRGRDAWEVSGGLGWQLRENMMLTGNYTGQFASNWDNHQIKVGLLIQF